MQVSNATLSSALFSAIGASAAASKQTAEQYLLQPVTIEGQIVEDDQKKKSTAQVKDRDESLSSNKERDQRQSSSSQIDDSASSLLIQAKLNNSIHPANNPEPVNSPELTGANNSDPINGIAAVTSKQAGVPDVNSFPSSNRRSFNGLAGESLVLQSYLDNEPANRFGAYTAASSIDIFI